MTIPQSLDFILLKQLANQCNEMLLAVDAATLNIVSANAQACHLLGYPSEVLIGMKIEVIEAGLVGMFYWQDVLGGNIQSMDKAESEFTRSDGVILTVEKYASSYTVDTRQFVLISATDITNRLNAENMLANVSGRLKSILESTADGILAISGAGTIEGMNHRFSVMWNISPEVLTSGNDKDVFEYLYQTLVNPDGLRAFLSCTDEGEHDASVTLRNGKVFELKSCPQQTTLGRVYSCNDVTAKVEAEREAGAARADAERANQAKGTFLASMSHEIRTPMNAIIGLSQLALNKFVSDEVRDYLEKINTSSVGLLGILNDILDFSKIEAGMLSIEYARFNLMSVVDNLLGLFSAKAAEKNLALNFEVPADIPLELTGDALRIQQVLNNLVGNALKFTAAGAVDIRLQRLIDSASRVGIRFSVTDTGIGMSEKDQLALFKPFSQADPSIPRRFGGSGLGLVISHKLVQLMGGEFLVQSQPGQGTTFSFELYFGVATDEMLHESVSQPVKRKAGDLSATLRNQVPGLSGIPILVAEDNLINQQVVKEFLQLSGMVVDIAGNGREALELLETHHYAAVLMDINMPEMGGVEATAHIRRQRRFDTLPVIALTAGVTQQERDRCLACGMNDFVSKPVNPQALLEALARWINSSATVHVRIQQSVPGELNGFDMALLREMLDGDETLVSELLLIFKGNLLNTLEDLDACVDKQDFQAAHVLTHSIKGISGSMGATSLFKAAGAMDELLIKGQFSQCVYDNYVREIQTVRDTLASL